MSYLNAKEALVEKNWNKRGIAGLRSELFLKVEDYNRGEWDDSAFVKSLTFFVYSYLPAREWDNAVRYIEETLGLVGISTDSNFPSLAREIRDDEEAMREEISGEDD